MMVVTSTNYDKDVWERGQAFINNCRQSHMAAVGILFSGDRRSCVTDMVIVEDVPDMTNPTNLREVVGVATLAEDGEQGSGESTLVGIMVHGDKRGQGYGKFLLRGAVKCALHQEQAPLQVDCLTKGSLMLMETLPDKWKQHVVINDLALELPVGVVNPLEQFIPNFS